VDGTGEAAAGEFFGILGPQWPLTARQRRRLTPAVQAALGAGWRPRELARFVAANTDGVRSPYAELRSRLSPGELPAPRPGWPAARRGATTATSTSGTSPVSTACRPAARPATRRASRHAPPDHQHLEGQSTCEDPAGEQQAIIDAHRTGGDLVIEAGAGTGKTTTLKMLGTAAPVRAGI
jgi:hypothetical protein